VIPSSGVKMKTILVVDDERSVRDSLRMILTYARHQVEIAEDGAKALALLESHPIDMVLLDIKMPGMDGMEVLEAMMRKNPELPVVMISGHGTIETAVEATKKGAFDFLSKPLDREKLLVTVRNALEQRKLAVEYKQMKEEIEGKEKILGESPKIKEILDVIRRVGPTDSRVLITGDNGTGKELVAKAIHRSSKRSQKPFIEVNCAAIPTELIESELFGHEKGSFTGATSQRIGKFEQADGGTIFLDEVGDMSLAAQAKVLRVLEEGKIERVGGSNLIDVDVRVVAATNKNLPEEISRNTFREDLYHRLNVIPIRVPPLRERREDIPLLASYFADEICLRNGMPRKQLTAGLLQQLKSMEWSGNVRELRNVVERLVIMSPATQIDVQALESFTTIKKTEFEDILSTSTTFQDFKDRAEAAYIKHQLELHNWHITKTAEVLNIQRSHLYNKIKRYGLQRGGTPKSEREGD
jgi:two-component system nitrogen regulation response regulator NtrX